MTGIEASTSPPALPRWFGPRASPDDPAVSALIARVARGAGWADIGGAFNLNVRIDAEPPVLRGAEPVPFTYSIVHCGSKSTIGDLEQKITHNCKETSYAYVWKNSVAYDIIDETQGKQRTGHDSSAWKLANHCH